MAEKRAFSTYLASTTRKGGKEEGRTTAANEVETLGGGGLETREEITVKNFWSIFIVGVPWEKSSSRVVFLQPCVSFREKEERNKERKANRNFIYVTITGEGQIWQQLHFEQLITHILLQYFPSLSLKLKSPILCC